MRNYNPQADYVVLLWCRHCGHCATQPVEPALTLEIVRNRARCGRCGRKWIGAVQMYEPLLGFGPGFLTCEIALIAGAVRRAAVEERRLADAIPFGSDEDRRQRHATAASVYERLAALLSSQAAEREQETRPRGRDDPSMTYCAKPID